MNRKQAIALIRKSDLSKHVDAIVECLKPSARIHVLSAEPPSSKLPPSKSHFGGIPSLPADMKWPFWDKSNFLNAQIARLETQFAANPRATGLRDIAIRMRKDLAAGSVPLVFLAQLYLSEIQAKTKLSGWPHDGSLAFFFDPSSWGFDPLVRGHCRIAYFPSDTSLVPAQGPKELPKESIFPQCRLQFEEEWTLPTRLDSYGVKLTVEEREKYRELVHQMVDVLDDNGQIHRSGGDPQEVQGDMRLECQLVTNGIYCGDRSGYQDPRRASLEAGAADWRLLLQLDSDHKNLGWMWGDAGRIYFWIRQQDIEALDFDGAWAITQCY